MNALDHVVPFARLRLPEQAGGWVPGGCFFALRDPPPIGYEGIPIPAFQRTDEMSDAGIHRDHQVEVRNKRRGIRKIFQRIAKMKNIVAFLQHCHIVGTDVFCKLTNVASISKSGNRERKLIERF